MKAKDTHSGLPDNNSSNPIRVFEQVSGLPYKPPKKDVIVMLSKEYQVGKFHVVVYEDGVNCFYYGYWHIASYNYQNTWWFASPESWNMSKEDADVVSELKELLQK